MLQIKRLNLILIFSLIIAYVIFSDDGKQYNMYVLLTSYLVAFFCIWNIFLINKFAYTLDHIFYLFVLFFFGIAPALQFKYDITFWGNINSLSWQDYTFFNLLLLLCLVIYNLSYSLFFRKQKIINNRDSLHENPVIYKFRKPVIFAIVIISFLLFAYSKNFNLLSIIFRGGFEDIQDPRVSGSLNLIIRIFVRPIPVICLLLFKYFKREKFSLFELFLIISVLISNSPIGMPRFQAAALYIPILFLYSQFLKKPYNFSLLLTSGLLVIFPLLSEFRDARSWNIDLSIKSKIFLEPSFDSYQNTLNVITENFITYGNQLVGVIFFFVPRSFWQDKPIGSGAFFAENNGYFFTNISMSYFGEVLYNLFHNKFKSFSHSPLE